MATRKVHSIRHTTTDGINYCDAMNASCEALETAQKVWVKEQGVCTNQGPHVQLTMTMHTLGKEAAALLCEGVQGNTIHIVHILRIPHIFHILYIVSVNVCNILACFQHESMMAWKRTTGVTGITRITLAGQMYLSGLIADSNNQMRHYQAGTFPGFASIFGAAQRYVDCWSTLYLRLVVGVTTWLPCNET